ncbi:MAG: Arsenical resistance operon repressor, ArsR [Promethearchaeota archaeon]|nr:MAG: Arsenical resistance operon repressor, ArsR [Candidatus Lokiarchaeota archaeon]
MIQKRWNKISLNENLADFLKILADPTRLDILNILKDGKERTTTEIHEILDLSQPAISQQLKKLENVDLLKARRESRKKYYKIKDPQIFRILTLLNLYMSNISKDKIEELADIDILDTYY